MLAHKRPDADIACEGLRARVNSGNTSSFAERPNSLIAFLILKYVQERQMFNTIGLNVRSSLLCKEALRARWLRVRLRQSSLKRWTMI